MSPSRTMIIHRARSSCRRSYIIIRPISFIIIITNITIMPKTTIAISQETRDLLKNLGNKGETYDEIIHRLLEDAGRKQLDNRWNSILANDEFIPLDEL